MSAKRITFYATLLFLLLAISWPLHFLYVLNQPIYHDNDAAEFYFEIKSGATATQVAGDLTELGKIKHPHYFLLWLRVIKQSRNLQAGQYPLTANLTLQKLVSLFITGDVAQHKFTIIEGWTLHDLMEAINDSEQLVKNVVLPDIDKIAGIKMSANEPPNTTHDNKITFINHFYHDIKSSEGLFFPETYYFTRGFTDSQLLKRAHELFIRKFYAEWEKRDKHIPYKTAYEALIAASLIEKECSLPHERAVISGVIKRRLERIIRLYVDATVIYGLGEKYAGSLSKEDLKDPSPYNTYIHYGLPPTPIAIPSLASIHAALHPDKSNYIYYVAKGDGSHYFSDNLQDHNRAVLKYQKNK